MDFLFFPKSLKCVSWGRDADEVEILCAASHHVAESSVASVAWSRVFAGAADVIDVGITAMGPAVVGVVVEPGGSGRFGSTLVTVTMGGAWRRCWHWSKHRWVGGEGLGDTLLHQGCDVRRRGDDAGDGGCVGDGWKGDGTLL